ncbi:uncharacterized protein LOC133523386 [Cydia pomonella]|uniref:uncharacterized protein LOC133523386 n=1 Tax=Cydia pomonella TaxID=82600 RepID=UPI002ADDF4BB|nr:uncharacterized protein LOC133523386 [Cydia pomonella]
MKTSSHLFMRNLRNILPPRKMEKHSNNSNNISADSLEENFKNKTSLVDTNSDDNVETVVVPFYEKDVVMKVPKDIKRVKQEKLKPKPKVKKEENASSYLVNKNMQSKRSSTYLEKFRNQFLPNYVENKQDGPEIRSISPEVGDTDRGNLSFGDEEQGNPVEEFHDTEAYNEIYYENLLQREVVNYSDTSSVEDVCFNDDLENKSPEDNLKSVSEVSQPRRPLRRVTMEPNVNVKLGGLGPDLESIRPQMMRTRSLQRYSDRVRAANRVSIYKKNVTENKQTDIESDPKSERKSTHNIPRRRVTEEKVSYLVNKSSEKTVQVLRKSHVSKSANPNKTSEVQETYEHSKRKSAGKKALEKLRHRNKPAHDGDVEQRTKNDSIEVRVRSGSKTIKTEIKPNNNEVPPIHISFLVNVENNTGSALKNLEEKHRRYQEMVKQYVNDYS